MAKRYIAWAGASVIAWFAIGCTAASTNESQQTTPAPVPNTWPTDLLTNEGTEPALFLGPARGAAAIGYVGARVAVKLTGAPQGDRAPVQIDGPLKIRGWMPTSRLALLVQRRGRVRGAPVYVAPNNLVTLVSDDEGGRMRVSMKVTVADGVTVGPFIGSYPLRGLAATPAAADAQALDPGEPHTVAAGTAIEVFERPPGGASTTIPASATPIAVDVLRHHGDWTLIRLGRGPYLVGWARVALGPAAPAAAPPAVTPAASGLPSWIEAEQTGQLLRVANGARVVFAGQVIARFKQAGYARELGRYESGEVDVFAAIDNSVAVRGMVRARSVRRVEGPVPAAGDGAATSLSGTGAAAAPTPAPATPPPAEDDPSEAGTAH